MATKDLNPNSPETKVPALPAPQSPQQLLQALKELVEVREGVRGNPLDQSVTWRELVKSGVAEIVINGQTIGGKDPTFPLQPPPVDSGGGVPPPDLTPPPQPTGLSATGAIQNVILSWNDPGNPNIALTEIWRSSTNVAPDTTGTTAALVGTTEAYMYADNVGLSNATRFYWVRFVSKADVDGPFSASVSGATGLVGGSDLSDAIITANKIAAGAISSHAAFGGELRPVASGATLPTLPSANYPAGALFFLTTDSKLYRSTGNSWVANVAAGDISGQLTNSQIADLAAAKLTGQIVATQIQDAAVTTAKFASGIEPVTIVTGALPTTKSTNQIYRTDDGKLYRWSGTAYVATVPTTDLTGQISDAQIAGLAASKVTGQLTNAQIAAIDAAKITGQLAASQLNVQIGGGNLLPSSGFETDTNSDGVADGWSLFAGGAGDAARVHQASLVTGAPGVIGSLAQRVAIVSATNTNDSAISSERVLIVPGGPYVVSAHVRSSVANKAFLLVRWYDASNASISDATAGFLTVANEWQRRFVAATAPPNAVRAQAFIRGINLPGEWMEVDGVQIEPGNLPTAYAPRPSEILPGTITSTQIANDAITSPKIVAGAIVSGKIAANAVGANEIAAGSITTAKIAAGAVTAGEIAAGAVTAGKIAASAVTATEIASGSITTAKIAAGAVTASEIASGAVTTGKLAALAVTANELAANAVTAGKIAAAAVSATEIAAGAITASKLFLSDLSNIAPDADMSDSAAWSGSVTWETPPSTAWRGSRVAKLDGASGAYTVLTGKVFPVEAGARLYLSIQGQVLAGGGAFGGQLRLSASPDMSSPSYGGVTPNTSTTLTTLESIQTVPAGMKYAQVQLFKNNDTATSVRVGGVVVRRAASAELIVDGAVVAEKIAANAITATKIAAGSVLTSKLTIRATEYVNPSSVTGTLNGWGGVTEDGVGTIAGLSYNATEGAIQLQSNGNHALRSDAWQVNHDKIYRVAVRLRKDSAGGLTYIGPAAFTTFTAGVVTTGNAVGAVNLTGFNASRAQGSTAANAYFDIENETGVYVSHVYYLIGANRSVNDCPAHTGPGDAPFVRMDATARWAAIRFLNWDNAGTTRNLFIKDVSVTEVGAGQIVAANIAANTITGDRIAAGTISAANIASGTITADRIATGTIVAGSGVIANGAITNALIGSLAVDSAKIADAAIVEAKIADASITNAKIANAAITDAKIATATITAASIANATITGAKIANATITAANITDATITTAKIADATITTAKIGDAQITGGKIGAATITGSNIAGGTIAGSNIAGSTITGSNIAGGTISAANIQSGTITGSLIAGSTITGSNIAGGTITAANIQNGTITGALIGSATITGSNIAGGTITAANIQNGTITGTLIGSSTITGSNIAGSTITGAQIAGSTITGGNIAGTTITAANIADSTITSAKIAGTIQSDNWSATTGWQINRAGTATFNQVSVRGKLIAPVPGFTEVQLGNDVVSAGHFGVSLSSTDFNNIFIRRNDGVVFFRAGFGGPNYIDFSSSGGLVIKGSFAADALNAVGTANVISNAVTVPVASSGTSNSTTGPSVTVTNAVAGRPIILMAFFDATISSTNPTESYYIRALWDGGVVSATASGPIPIYDSFFNFVHWYYAGVALITTFTPGSDGTLGFYVTSDTTRTARLIAIQGKR